MPIIIDIDWSTDQDADTSFMGYNTDVEPSYGENYIDRETGTLYLGEKKYKVGKRIGDSSYSDYRYFVLPFKDHNVKNAISRYEDMEKYLAGTIVFEVLTVSAYEEDENGDADTDMEIAVDSLGGLAIDESITSEARKARANYELESINNLFFEIPRGSEYIQDPYDDSRWLLPEEYEEEYEEDED